VKTAVWSGRDDHPRIAAWIWPARRKLPVSTRTSPSSVSKAATFAKLETKATPRSSSSSSWSANQG
jgi:hypothetical protein